MHFEAIWRNNNIEETKNITMNLSTTDEDKLNLILVTAIMLDYEVEIRYYLSNICNLSIILSNYQPSFIELNIHLTTDNNISVICLYKQDFKYMSPSTTQVLDQMYNQLIGDLA